MSGDANQGWYFASGNDRQGPFPQAQMIEMARQGRLTPDTQVWTEGMGEWIAMGQSVLAPLIRGAAPPPPPRPATPPPAPWVAPVQATYAQGPYVSAAAPVMGFGQAISTCLRKYVTFSGRANRPEYWYFLLFLLLFSMAMVVVDISLFGTVETVDGISGDAEFAPFSSLFSLAMLLPSLAALFRRLHDTDRSGWWILIGLIPLLGVIVLVVFLCSRGTPGPNRFG